MNMQTPPLKAGLLTPANFFTGNLEFSGFVQDLAGVVRRHYHGTIACHTQAGVLTLDEALFFNDGAQETRVWNILAKADQIVGNADDLVGDAAIDPISPDEMRWRYTMRVEIGGKRRPFDFEDVFVQTKDDIMIAKTTMKKFGVPLARLYSHYRRV